MLDKVIIGSYYNTNSLIHNMNSTIKIICTIIFAIVTFLSFNIYINLFIIFLLIIMILLSNIPLVNYIKSIFNIKWLLLFIFIINLIFERNIYITIIIVLRVIIALTYTMMLIYTTKQEEIVYGLQKVLSPLKLIKIPVNKMAFSIGMALRFIPNLIESSNRVLKSLINRGIYIKSLKLKNKIELLKSIIIPIFILSIKKADALSEIMEVRLYNINNTGYDMKTKLNYFDVLIISIHLVLLILIIKKGVFI